jgi:phosphonate transport system substrate-binding protein
MLVLYRAMCDQLERTTGIHIDLKQSTHDSLDDPALKAGEVDLAFICGLPLVRLSRTESNFLQPLVAPIVDDPRGEGKPMYFADVIVRRDSTFLTFADLAGSTFCYNDPGSNSGHHLLRHHMFKRGYAAPFFDHSVQSGGHVDSIQRVIEGVADCAAIDSTVLAQAIRDNPVLADQIRVIESTHPCPVPPLAFYERETGFRAQFQDALNKPDQLLTEAMRQAGIQAFAAVNSDDYAAIGEMFDAAESANYQIIQ